MAPSTRSVTNFEFAEAVDLHHTMASRLRNGERLPSLPTFIRVMRAYDLNDDQTREWLDAIAEGAKASGAWLVKNIFEPDAAALPEAG